MQCNEPVDGHGSYLLIHLSLMYLEIGTVKGLGVLLQALREEFTTHTWVIHVGITIAILPGFGAVSCICY